jgi:NAD(P)-dependent dehydrogenase (short-subunit alcohol dehydrogenase family)
MKENKNSFNLKGKNIVVTGASSGIGRQCAISCNEMGARVVLMGRDKSRLQETLSRMKGDGHLITTVDLLDYQEVEKAVKYFIEKVDKIGGLINCAGISTTLPFSQSKPDKMEQFFRTNVIGAMNLTRLIVKKGSFPDNGGSIIFISSVMGSVGEVGKNLYSMTKGAIDAGVRSLAIELAPKKIRVNSISPGVVITPMSQNAIYSRDEESLNKVKALHPLGLGQPDDVANACIFLLSDAAWWITGTNMIIDGGYLAR